MYCDRGQGLGRQLCRDTVGRPSHDTAPYAHDTVVCARRYDAMREAQRATHSHDTAAGPATRRLCAAIRSTGHPRYGAGQAATRPLARGLGAACVRRLSCGCAHGALGQFLTQYCF